jgi:hypothetical protein
MLNRRAFLAVLPFVGPLITEPTKRYPQKAFSRVDRRHSFHDGSEFAAMMHTQTAIIAASYGLPYEMLARDLKAVSYSQCRLLMQAYRRDNLRSSNS